MSDFDRETDSDVDFDLRSMMVTIMFILVLIELVMMLTGAIVRIQTVHYFGACG